MQIERRIPTLNKETIIFPGIARPLFFAHRGLSSRAPENTLAAFNLARNEKIPGIELDVHLCASGELVIFHDDTTKRVTDSNLRIEETTYSKLKKLDIGSWFSKEFSDERIPLLQDLFDLTGNEVYYDIEIKTRAKNNSELTSKLYTLIKKNNLEEHCLISSFNPLVLKDFSKLTKTIPTAIIYSNDQELPFYLRGGLGEYIGKTSIIKPDKKITTKRKNQKKHKRGKLVIPWTVDDPEEMKTLLEYGVDGIVSNRPDILIKSLYKSQKTC